MANINSFVSMHQGEYKEILVQVQNTAGQGINITNVTLIKWALAASENASGALLVKSFPSSGIVLTDPTNGYYTIVISGVDTTLLAPGTYYQEAFYNLGGKTIESVVGTVRIRPTII